MNKLTVYGASWCGDCIRTKSFLDQHQIDYDYIDIEKEEQAVEIVLELNHGKHIIPTLIFPNGESMAEPSNQALAEILKLD